MTLKLHSLLVICLALTCIGCESDDDNKGPSGGATSIFAMYTTTDGGITWKEENPVENLGTYPALLGHFAANGYVLHISEKVYASTNNGAFWTPINRMPGAVLTDISAVGVSDINLVACSKTEGILYSTNAGASWDVSTSTPTDIRRFNIWPYPVGFALSLTEIHKTTDGGVTWTTLPPPPVPDGVHFSDADFSYVGNTLLVTDDNGFVHRTHNDGANWVATELDAVGNDLTLINIEDDGATVNVFTTQGIVYRSLNTGTTWISPPGTAIAASTIHDISGPARGLYVTGDNTKAAFSSDQGATWSPVTLPGTRNVELRAVSFSDDDHGMIVGRIR